MEEGGGGENGRGEREKGERRKVKGGRERRKGGIAIVISPALRGVHGTRSSVLASV